MFGLRTPRRLAKMPRRDHYMRQLIQRRMCRRQPSGACQLVSPLGVILHFRCNAENCETGLRIPPLRLPELAAAVRPEQSARVDHAPQRVGSAHNQNVVNSPSKGSDERSGVYPAPRAKVKRATDGSRAIGENRKGQEEVWQSSRTLKDRRQRFAELINHPLEHNCINCLLFGY